MQEFSGHIITASSILNGEVDYSNSIVTVRSARPFSRVERTDITVVALAHILHGMPELDREYLEGLVRELDERRNP